MADRVGQRFGDYYLLRLLGRGGSGDVYLGQQIDDRSYAAIKVMHGPLTVEGLNQFIVEASTNNRLIHPQIVKMLDFGSSDDTPFLVLEYLSNGSLHERHKPGAILSLPTIISYVNPISAALQYAHDRKRIHRDIKPGNILLGSNNEVLLSDFSIAIEAHTTKSWVEQNAYGTPPYMAPEQFRGKALPASDQYSLGIVIYEWMCGRRPFIEGDMGYHHNYTLPTPLREIVPTISPEIEQVVMKALQKNPQERFANVRNFAQALESASKSEQSNIALRPSDLSTTTSTVLLTQPSTLLPYSHQISQNYKAEVQIPQGGLLCTYPHIVGHVLWSPDGKCIATSGDRSIHVWEATTGRCLCTYHGHNNAVWHLVWSPDSSRIASSDMEGNNVHIWDTITGERLLIYNGHTLNVCNVAWSPDGKRIASAERNLVFHNIHIWNPITGYHYLTYPDRNIIFDSPHYQQMQKLFESAVVQSLAIWSPDSRYIASATSWIAKGYWAGDGVEIRDANTGQIFLTYDAHSDGVWGLSWSPNGVCIASAGGYEDRTIKIWIANSGKTVWEEDTGADGMFIAHPWSFDSRYIVFRKYKTIEVRDGGSGHSVFIYRGHTGDVHTVVWSPDGKHIASVGSDENTVHVWRAV